MKILIPNLCANNKLPENGFESTQTKVHAKSQRAAFPFLIVLSLILFSTASEAQLGVYDFTGPGACPHQNPNIISQPANASFSIYANVNAGCVAATDIFENDGWNTTTTIDLNQYNEFIVTADMYYGLTLTSLSFTQYTNEDAAGGTSWSLRSSIDNYTTDIATGSATTLSQSPVIMLPGSSFSNVSTVTFRLYLINANSSATIWSNDDVILNGSVSVVPPADPGNPSSDSPQCSNPGVTVTANGFPPAGETWYWQTSASGTNTSNAASTYTVNTSGTYYIRSQNNTTLAWSIGAGSIVVIVTPDVSTPVFTVGASSVRCQGAGTVTYTGTASDATGITYSLDAASITGGNTIDINTGDVTYVAGWSGTSIITASAAGCNGPATATHTVTVTPTVGTPVFTLGATSTRCQGAGTVTYTGTASDATGITYSLDAASITGGNTIDINTGDVTYVAGWSSTSIITASAAGCNGPATATHTVTITPSVGTPVFSLGGSSIRCKGGGTVTYTATATNTTEITYSLDAASIAGGITINPATGAVTYPGSWTGTTIITASAAGCGGPLTVTHTVTTYDDVKKPVFAMGNNSTRCQGAGTVTYSSTAINSTSITYSLDAASIAGGNTINSTTGEVTYIAGWSGATTITASAAGCNGPKTEKHDVTVDPSVGTPVYTLGPTSTRCQGAGSVTYSASAANNTGISYNLDAASLAAGNTINSGNGKVNYVAGWSGTSIITVTATGCNGPVTATHTVTTTPSVTTPVFTLGATSTRCQGAGTVTYDATATNTTGITYSLNAAAITGGNSINSSTGDVTYVAGWTGATIITASAAGCGGPLTATHTVTITPTVGTPVFTLGAISTRCQGAGTVTYTATATNNTGLTYSLDAASITGGNTINSSTGAVTYVAGWTGSSIITVTATGCNGPSTATHTVAITPTVGTPVFTLGATTTRCQGASTVTYTASATNTTGITYSLDATSLAGSNTINSSTGAVTYAAGWNGTTTITASAAGCNGPSTSIHTVTITPTTGTPVFTLGATSTRCQGAGVVTYIATASNSTGITYSLDAASSAGGNTINSSTGDVTYTAVWSGTTTITASAAGCNGPKTATHTVTINLPVTTPVFTLGATSTRCQGAATVTYTATASNTTGINYSLDAASIASGNTINSSTGAVTYAAGWSGSSTITASAAGCTGPKTAIHTVTITPTVGTPVFVLGTNSTRCFGASTINYSATATTATGITYSLDALSAVGGCTINSSTGNVTYSGSYFGNSTITAAATGCNGPKTATHTVTVNPSVGTPVFVLGSGSTRCQGSGIVTYTATAINTTGIIYSLDAASIAGGNTINSSTGDVTYAAGWSGTTTITASAAGCNGPKTDIHTVTITPTVSAPVFTLGNSSTRCQGANLITYTANAANSNSITYTLDAASLAGGNTINTATGLVAYVAGWSGSSTITASATGCNGPATATHTATTTATVGVPVFTLGATSTRCQGAGTVTYTATATNTTGITYSLDAASIAAGNSINAGTGVVTYTAGWSGTTTITASAAGCNGPRTSTHIVTISPSVGTPVFAMGVVSTRPQGAGSVTYTATASNTTGITYSLDAASIAGGNTINSATGQVTYSAGWGSSTIITASAAGCGGPKTSTHTVMTNASTVIKQLYLSDPAQALDRVDPVNTADATTAGSALLSSTGTAFTTFTMAPVLCDFLTIKAGTITVKNYITVSSGTMSANPAITAQLSYGATTIITLTNPTYNSGLLTWTATLGADVTVPAGQAITLRITTAEPGVIFRIDYDSQTKPSKIDLPVSTFININSLDLYSAAYPGGIPVSSGVGGNTYYFRATVSDPFGSADITGMNITITPPGSTFAATSVATAGCTRTYQYVWTTPVATGTYAISASAKEGYENTVNHTRGINFDLCVNCPPIAVNDSASGAGGTPVTVDVLANDNDPNNNLNNSSLTIVAQPANGSAYISGNLIVYVPNGTYQGKDTLTYRVCDLSSPTPLCATAQVFFTIDPLVVDICGAASQTHTYYIPYPEDQAYKALRNSGSPGIPSNNIRTVISIKIPYTGLNIIWDEWEDGYETNILSPVQSTTKVWGDGNPFNGVAPGYPSDIIPAGGSIILDNTMNANPRNPATIYYDGKDKIVASAQIAVTQVCGEPSIASVQSMKTNVTSTDDFGQSFTIPLGQDFNSQDFKYTALFIRASQNNTTINIDKDNNGTLETTAVLNEGQSYFVDGGVLTGATVTSDKPIGVELNAGGVDNYSLRNAPIFPATWYSHTYYTPVPTSDNAGDSPKDSSAVMFYNSLNRSISINWSSGVPASGSFTIPAKSAVRFPLAYSTTAAYKFVNPTGESYTAIEIVDSYTPGGGGNDGMGYDWSFNLISELRLTDYATVAWAPGGLDLGGTPGPDVNGNPIWVTPTANTTIYVKYDGNISGTTGLLSPCGLRYDVSYNVNALNYIKIKDPADNDQSGIALYTCNGAKIAAVYGEDPQGSTAGNSAYWDVGTTIQPFCKQKLIIATDDAAATLVNQPVTIPVLDNDLAFLATINPSSVSTLGLLQPKNGTISINADGTILYIPNAGFAGKDTFEYNVCSAPSPVVCDIALVTVSISSCPSTGNQNVISGQVFLDRNNDAANNDGGIGLAGIKILLYTDGNCNSTIDANELTDSVTVDASGFYQFIRQPEKTIEDNFDNTSGGSTCASGSDGDSPWAGNWVDAGDLSVGYCNSSQTVANTDVEVTVDGAFGFGLRLKDKNVSATRSVDLSGAIKAFLTFSYRRKSNTLTSGEDIYVQASSNGSSFTTIYTIKGDGNADANYVTIYNQDITSYASATSAIRFLTSNNVDDQDTVYIDNIAIRFLKYPQCYITKVDPASVPASYTITTANQRTTSFTSGGSCTSQFDFGFKKPNISISGALRNDKNGTKDGIVGGPVVGSPGGATVYVYLTDFTGKVAFKTTVHPSAGVYTFANAETNSDYVIIFSTINVALGASPPASFALPSPWGPAGDSYGTNNLAGTGVEAGIPDGAISIKTGTTNISTVDFGIQRQPNSDNYIASINHPTMNQVITLNGGINPPVLSGTDPEDCSTGCVLAARDVIIDTIPNNAELYYNSSLVTSGQLISNFNASLLQVRVTGATLGDTMIVFDYSFVDAAGLKDPSPASYKLIWLVPLPADRLTASANLNGSVATVKWSTLSEQNTSHYIVERSIDNVSFAVTGNKVSAAGNSTTTKEYQLQDNISSLMQNTIIYYRVKLVDLDGKVKYSNIVAVRLSQQTQVSIWPNPFHSSFTVNIKADRETIIDVNLIDVNGRLIKKSSQPASRGLVSITVGELDQLPRGIYLVEIFDRKAGTTYQKLLANQ